MRLVTSLPVPRVIQSAIIPSTTARNVVTIKRLRSVNHHGQCGRKTIANVPLVRTRNPISRDRV